MFMLMVLKQKEKFDRRNSSQRYVLIKSVTKFLLVSTFREYTKKCQ